MLNLIPARLRSTYGAGLEFLRTRCDEHASTNKWEIDIVKKYSVLLLIVALILPLALGCEGKEFGHVTGVVTINGEPVEGASITFAPAEGGRSAFGITGADGSYELDYTPGDKGAKIGVNNVSITTYSSPRLDDDNRVVEEGTPERFPPEYNENGSETVEVVKGDNTFDFAIETDQESYPRSEED